MPSPRNIMLNQTENKTVKSAVPVGFSIFAPSLPTSTRWVDRAYRERSLRLLPEQTSAHMKHIWWCSRSTCQNVTWRRVSTAFCSLHLATHQLLGYFQTLNANRRSWHTTDHYRRRADIPFSSCHEYNPVFCQLLLWMSPASQIKGLA